MTPDTPLKETALCLADLVRRGKTLYVGMSNYDGKTMHRMYHKCDDVQAPFVINQNRYSIFDRTVEKNKLLKEARDKGKGVICFSPLAQGNCRINTPKASRRAPACLATKSCKPMWVMISTVPSRLKSSISWQRPGRDPFSAGNPVAVAAKGDHLRAGGRALQGATAGEFGCAGTASP